MRADRRVFIKSENGKVRLGVCPYATFTDERVRLTAAQYARSDRCLCSTCWTSRPEFHWVETYVWETEALV